MLQVHAGTLVIWPTFRPSYSSISHWGYALFRNKDKCKLAIRRFSKMVDSHVIEDAGSLGTRDRIITAISLTLRTRPARRPD